MHDRGLSARLETRCWRVTLNAMLLALAAVVVLAGPARAQEGSVEDQWAKANRSCAAFFAFKGKYPNHPRFARYYPDREKACRPATPPKATPPKATPTPAPRVKPSPTPTRRPTPTPTARPKSKGEYVIPPAPTYTPTPPPYTPPAPTYTPTPQRRESSTQRSRVTLAPYGGDTNDFSTALNLVQPGGTIVVRPGRYRVATTIAKAVNIEAAHGDRDSAILEGNIVISSGSGTVSFFAVTLRNPGLANVLQIFSPASCTYCRIETGSASASGGQSYSLVWIGSGGSLRLNSSTVLNRGDCTGCGAIYYTVGALAGNTISYSTITSSSLAVNLSHGSLSISDTAITTRNGDAVFQSRDAGSLSISNSRFGTTGEVKFYAITSLSGSRFRLTGSSFYGMATNQALHIDGRGISDINYYSSGNRLVK